MAKKEEKKVRKKAVPRQSWKPHWVPSWLYRFWRVFYSLFKVAMVASATVTLVVLVCAFVLVGLLGSYLQDDILPDSEMVKENYDLDETSFIHYVDSSGNIQELQRIYASTTDREWATYDEFPEDLIHATVAIEDKRFYEHQGVDWITTVKACVKMFVGSGDAGGSTITQQLVKNMTGDNSITVRRKVVEIFKAIDFERRYDKDVIMEWYLNLIYFGDRKNGVKSAAAHYFGKELETLTTAECASLISITNNPSIFSPYASTFEYKGKVMTGVERNHIRKENTLYEMRNQGYLSEDDYQVALAQELEFKSGIAPEDTMAYCENLECGYKGIVSTLTVDGNQYFCPQCEKEIPVGENASQKVYSWFVDTVMEDVAAALAERDGLLWEELSKEQKTVYTQLIQRSGYHIYTTLDMDVQNQVDAIYTNLEEIPETRGGQQLQSGIVVIDNRTGDIVAMAGGVGEKTVFDGYNLATDARLQVGSSFKPIAVYAPAFELGAITPATVVKDLPLRYAKDSGKTQPFPRNAEKNYHYSRTVLSGLIDSVNAISVHTLDMIGTRYSYNFAKEKFHISGLVDNERYTDVDYAPLGLGGLTYGATVRDMACAYATFANKGVYREGRTFTKVYDSQGNLVIDNEQKSEQILSEKTVTYMNYCLDQAVDHGTGDMADIKGMDVCGKTGTTNSKKDRYFCGYTGYYTAAVWCGFETPAEIQLVGDDTRHPAARLWRKVMAPLHEGKDTIRLYNKDKMVKVRVCLDSGKLATDACRADIRGDSRTESVLIFKEDYPESKCDKHTVVTYCTEGEGVANEYCEKFAKAKEIEVKEVSLVKMTQSQIDEIKKAGKYGLKSKYVSNEYIYLVNKKGEDAGFTGFEDDLDGSAPYVTCKVHTKKAWEKFHADHPNAGAEEETDKEKPDAEKTDEEKPKDEKPKEEKPKDEKPKEEKPKEEKPKEETTGGNG